METKAKNILGHGSHIVKIKSVKVAYSNKNLEWSDQTPQLELLFENEQGYIRKWYNLVGYKKFWELTKEEMESGQFTKSDIGDYALRIYKSGALSLKTRIFCEERTKQCLKIIKQLAEELEIGSENFCLRDFIGKQAEIDVFEKSNKTVVVEKVKKVKLHKQLEVAQFEQLLPIITIYYKQREGLL